MDIFKDGACAATQEHRRLLEQEISGLKSAALEKEILALKKRVEALEAQSAHQIQRNIYGPCNNAYKDSRDGLQSCPCWRCSPYEKL